MNETQLGICMQTSQQTLRKNDSTERKQKKKHTQICNPWTWDWVLESDFLFRYAEWLQIFFSSFLFAESFNSEGHEIACNKHKRDKFYWFFKHNKKNMHWMKMMDLANFQFVRFEMLSEERKMDERAFCYYAKTATFCPNHYLLHNLSLMASKW